MAKCKKPSLGPHYGRVQNPIPTFTAAYAHVQKYPGKIYKSTGGKDFEAIATVSQSGERKDWKVIKFKTKKSEDRAYKKCWGRVTNYAGAHIDIYTTQIK
jgi:hypothetical protein